MCLKRNAAAYRRNAVNALVFYGLDRWRLCPINVFIFKNYENGYRSDILAIGLRESKMRFFTDQGFKSGIFFTLSVRTRVGKRSKLLNYSIVSIRTVCTYTHPHLYTF